MTATTLDRLFDKAVSDRYSFDRFDQATQDWLRYQQDDLIKELETDVRDVIEMVVQRGVRAGWDAEQMADQIREVISLTETQSAAVMNYRSMLENLDPQALGRQLRSTDYDELVREAIDSDEALGAEAIDQMVADYEDNYLDYRADTIAGTEASRMANQGLQDSYEQAITRGVFPEEAVKQFWRLGLNEKHCDICLSVVDENEDGIAMGETFDSIEGPQDGPPAHPNCECEVEIEVDLDQVPDEEEQQ